MVYVCKAYNTIMNFYYARSSRPISLLSIFDKIMEKLMHIIINGFLEDNNILYKNQIPNLELEKVIPHYMQSYKLLKKSENQLTKVNLGVVFSLI